MKHTNAHYRALAKPRRFSMESWFGIAGSLALIGIFAVVLIRASSSFVVFEPDNATPAGPAVVTTDRNAAGGKAIVFNAPVSAPAPAPTPTSATPCATPSARPFSPSSPFNTLTPAVTQWFDTPALHIRPGVTGTSDHWYVNVASGIVWCGKPSDPVWTFNLTGYTNAPEWNRTRPATTFHVHAPANMHDGTDSDHVVFVIDGDTYYEVWNAHVDPATMTVTHGDPTGSRSYATGSITTSPGAGTLGGLNDGTRASNFSWGAGLITGRDLTNGKIDHALAIALTDAMYSNAYTSYVPPATAWDNGGHTGLIKTGMKLGIPPGTPRPAGLSSLGSMVFDALQKYGAYVGDFVGGQWPTFYTDQLTVAPSQMTPLYAWWTNNGSADMDKIGPLLRVANYHI